MKTKRQKELIGTFLSILDDETATHYRELILHLSELGYNPHKQRAFIVFNHDKHNKQIAKIGIKRNKEQTPFFALRFSACREYSKRFEDIIREAIIRYPSRDAGCIKGECSFCKGEPNSHVYSFMFPDGETKNHCGARALEIPDIGPGDMAEIKKLMNEEHIYLMKHQAGMIVDGLS